MGIFFFDHKGGMAFCVKIMAPLAMDPPGEVRRDRTLCKWGEKGFAWQNSARKDVRLSFSLWSILWCVGWLQVAEVRRPDEVL